MNIATVVAVFIRTKDRPELYRRLQLPRNKGLADLAAGKIAQFFVPDFSQPRKV
jgi:hypothetical protein